MKKIKIVRSDYAVKSVWGRVSLLFPCSASPDKYAFNYRRKVDEENYDELFAIH